MPIYKFSGVDAAGTKVAGEREAVNKQVLQSTLRKERIANIVVKEGTALPKGHQLWQVNEVNALIWPNTSGIGVMSPAAFKQTANIAYKYKVIKKPATAAAYRTDLAKKAVAALKKQGVDVYGKGWKKKFVRLTPGGK